MRWNGCLDRDASCPRSSRQRCHQPPVDPPAIRIGCPRRELLDHPSHPPLRIRGTARTMYLLIPQISRGTHPDLALLERLAHQRGRQVPAIFRVRTTARKVKNTVIILHQDPARHRARQATVYLRNLQARRYGCLMPPVAHLGNGSHLPTVINGPGVRPGGTPSSRSSVHRALRLVGGQREARTWGDGTAGTVKLFLQSRLARHRCCSWLGITS